MRRTTSTHHFRLPTARVSVPAFLPGIPCSTSSTSTRWHPKRASSQATALRFVSLDALVFSEFLLDIMVMEEGVPAPRQVILKNRFAG